MSDLIVRFDPEKSTTNIIVERPAMSELTSDMLDRDVFCEHMNSTSDHSRRLIFLHDSAQRQQLAAVTQERDAFERKYELILNDQDYQQCCDLIRLADESLATAQARITELELKNTSSANTVARVRDLEASIRDVRGTELNCLSNMGISFVEKAVKWYQQQLAATEQDYEAVCHLADATSKEWKELKQQLAETHAHLEPGNPCERIPMYRVEHAEDRIAALEQQLATARRAEEQLATAQARIAELEQEP